MTEWKKGGSSLGIPADSTYVCEYREGQIWIIGARRGDKLYYAVRKWKNGETIISEPKLVSDEAVSGDVQTWISKKDGFVQLTCGGEFWYIDPMNIDEIGNDPIIPVERSNLPVSLELYAAIPSYVRLRDDVFWDEHIHRIREETHIERVTSFAYAVEEKGVWNGFTPWALSGNAYNLAVWNEVYFERVQELAEIFNRRGVLLIPVLMPGAYGETPYRRNTNGVANEWTKEALPFQNSFHGRLLRILKNVYGERHLWCRLSNEVSRMGSWLDDIRTVTHRHEAWHRHIQDLVPIQRTISDSSHSDFTLLTEAHLYVRLRGGEEKMIPEAHVGEYDIEEVMELWGDNAWNRLSRPELHGINPQKLDESVEEGPTLWETVRGCGWKRFVMSTDGNTWGSGELYIGGTYRNMSKEQLRELARFFWKTEGPKYEMNIIIAEHPKEVHFRNANGVIEENYAFLNFDRLKAFREVYSG